MKNTIKISTLLASVLILASCSTITEGDNATPPQDTDSTTATATSTATTEAPTATVKLSENSHDEIYAVIHTTYNGNPEGSVELKWTAPKDSGCYNTEFPITKYGEDNDMTWATVEIKQGDKYCSGTWTADIMYNNQSIASNTINISK